MRTGAPRACTENLGDGPQNARIRFGVASLGVGLLLAVVAVELRAPRAVFLLLFLPFFAGATALSMGLTRTCTALAAGGMRNLGDGRERVVDPRERHALRLRGLRVALYGFVAAAVATGLLFATAR